MSLIVGSGGASGPPPSIWQAGHIEATDQPAPPTEGPVSEPRPRRWPLVVGWITAVVVVLFAFANVYRLDYYSIAPGDALNVPDRVTIEGRETFDPEGELMLLFVRERARITLLRYIVASLDPDIDVVKSEVIAGDQSPDEVRAAAVAEMASAQAFAKIVALDAIGEEADVRPGARVISTIPGRPADGVLQIDDVIVGIDDAEVDSPDDLGDVIGELEPGDEVDVEVRRGDDTITERITLAGGPVDTDGDGEDDAERPQLGVYTLLDYTFPFGIEIDTSDIGGPSAGLAMSLAIIDQLTEGDLTGGAKVAITGTIDPEGNVGQVGGIPQKAVAARVRGATLLLVPSCEIDSDDPAARRAETACREELDDARSRADDVEIVEVATVDDALEALADHGGDPLPAEA